MTTRAALGIPSWPRAEFGLVLYGTAEESRKLRASVEPTLEDPVVRPRRPVRSLRAEGDGWTHAWRFDGGDPPALDPGWIGPARDRVHVAGGRWVSGLVLVLATIACADEGVITEGERDDLLARRVTPGLDPSSGDFVASLGWEPWYAILQIDVKDVARLSPAAIRMMARVQHATLLRRIGDGLRTPGHLDDRDFLVRLHEAVVRARDLDDALSEADEELTRRTSGVGAGGVR